MRWWQADLADIGAVQNLFHSIQPHTVYHFAGLATGSHDLGVVLPTLRDNLQTTVNLLTAVTESGTGRLILPGSLEEPDSREGAPVPCSPYAASKWASSSYAKMFHRLYGTPVVIARVFMVYGPQQPDLAKLIPYVVLSLLRDESPKLSSGSRLIDWIFIDDLVEGLLAVAQTSGLEGRTVDLGSGSTISIRRLVEEIHRIIDSAASPVFGSLEDRPHERETAADVAETARLCGWTPATSVETGLRLTVDWYRSQLADGLLPEGGDPLISRR